MTAQPTPSSSAGPDSSTLGVDDLHAALTGWAYGRPGLDAAVTLLAGHGNPPGWLRERAFVTRFITTRRTPTGTYTPASTPPASLRSWPASTPAATT